MKNKKTTQIFGFEKKKIFKFLFCSEQKIFFCTSAMRIFCTFQMFKNVKNDKVRALTKTCFLQKDECGATYENIKYKNNITRFSFVVRIRYFSPREDRLDSF